MFRTAIYWTVFWLYQIAILPSRWRCQWLARQGRESDRLKAAYRQSIEWSRLLLKLSGSRIERTGLENIPLDRAVLYVSNHQCEFDIPILLRNSPRPTAFVAKKELETVPFVSFWMKSVGCEFLDRENKRQMVAVARNTAKKLSQGISMVVFPEGTRSNQDEMAHFKKGSLSLAERAGVSIVPVAIKNSHQMKKKKSLIIQKADVSVHFFPPIDPASLSPQEKDTLHIRIHEMIQEKVRPSNDES